MAPALEEFPREFGKYRLIERIAFGGMAELFRAKLYGASGFEKDVAIKKVLPSLSKDASFVDMLMDEQMIMRTLSHGNIVSILDFGEVDGEYFLVMEYVDGVDLQTLLKCSDDLSNTLPVPIAAYIARQICQGLDYAHRKSGADGLPLQIVHRDVTPHNILISFEGEVKIADFGIARAASRITSTQAGIIKGKVAYLSPEQIQDGHVDNRCDIFAAGILLYEMLTLHRPFEGNSPMETMALICRGEYTKPHKVNPKVDKKLSAILHKALAADAEKRYQTAGEMEADLSFYLHETGQRPDASAVAQLIPQRLPDAKPKVVLPTPVRTKQPSGRSEVSGKMAPPAGRPDDETLPLLPAEPERSGGSKSRRRAEGGSGWVLTGSAGSAERTPSRPTARPRIERILFRWQWVALAIAAAILIGFWFGFKPMDTLSLSEPRGAGPAPQNAPAAAPTLPREAVLEPAKAPQPEPPPAADPAPIFPSADAPMPTLPLGSEIQAPAPAPQPKPGVEPIQAVPEPRANAEPKPMGQLKIDSEPPSMVFIDRKKIGPTPLAGLQLPAGVHTLVLRNESLGLVKRKKIHIEPDKEHEVFLRLEGPP